MVELVPFEKLVELSERRKPLMRNDTSVKW
jgi:hypothetical protein